MPPILILDFYYYQVIGYTYLGKLDIRYIDIRFPDHLSRARGIILNRLVYSLIITEVIISKHDHGSVTDKFIKTVA